MSAAPTAPANEALAADEVAAPPPMEVRSHVWVTPDGRVVFGALFEELVPVARALDPDYAPAPAPAADE